MSSAYLAEMCVNHFGKYFFINSRIACKYISATLAGEVISTHGVITEKTPTERGVRFTVDIWAQNQDGEKKTAGEVEVDVDR